MDFLIPVTIDRIRFHPPSRSYAVILEDEPSQRKLPIMIGTYEAQSIAIAIEKKHVTRPMTHDLVTSLLTEFDFRLNSIHINDLIEGVFYARLVVESMDNGHEQNIDCRPSDAIAIAVRMDVPIRVAKHVIDEAGYVEDPISVEE